MAGPYGITQVDVPGLLNVYTAAQDARTKRLMQNIELQQDALKLKNAQTAAQAWQTYLNPPTTGVGAAYNAPSTAPAAPSASPAPADTVSPQDDPQAQARLLSALAPTMAPKDFIDLQNAFAQHTDEQRKQAAQDWNYIGGTALEIRNVPEAQRLALFDQRAPMLQSLGVPAQMLQQARGVIAQGNSDQYLEGLANHARDIENVIKGETPTVTSVPGVGLYPTTPGSPFRDFSNGGAAPSAQVGPAPKVKVLNGKTYHQDPVTGDWYEGEPAGNGGSNFSNIERYYGGQ